MANVYERYGFSEEFQHKVIACFIAHPQKFDVHADMLRPEYFTTTAAFDVVFHAKEYYGKYLQWPDFSMLANYCFAKLNRLNPDKATEAGNFVSSLAELDTSDADAIFDLVRDFARERSVYRALRTAHSALMEGKPVEGGLVQLFQSALEVGGATEDLGVFLHKDYEDLLRQRGVSDVGIPCGSYGLLNGIWRNGWEPGWLVVPLAPPKRYKTTFAINLAMGLASEMGDSYDVLYYACEISQKLAALRALCSMTGFTMDQITDNREVMLAAAKAQMTRMQGRILFKSFPSKTATIDTIRAHALNAVRVHKLRPKMIVIDYAETVRVDMPKGTPDARISAEVYTQARALGDQLGSVVIMPDRCNRETVSRAVPSMTGFQGAFEKAGIVDVGIGLCQTEAEHLQNRMRYFIFLNRHGREGVHLSGVVDPAVYRMTIDEEIPYDPDEAEEENQGHRGGGGGRGGHGRRPKNDKVQGTGPVSRTALGKESAAALAEDEAARAAHPRQMARNTTQRPHE